MRKALEQQKAHRALCHEVALAEHEQHLLRSGARESCERVRLIGDRVAGICAASITSI